MCGEDLACPVADMPVGWAEAKDKLGAALVDAQKIVGKRVKIGTIWVSSSRSGSLALLFLRIVWIPENLGEIWQRADLSLCSSWAMNR